MSISWFWFIKNIIFFNYKMKFLFISLSLSLSLSLSFSLSRSLLFLSPSPATEIISVARGVFSFSLYFSLPLLSFIFPLLSPLLSRTRACARNRRSGRSLPLFLSTSSLLSFFHLSSFSRAFFIFFSPPPFSLLAAHFSPSTTRAEETSSCPYSSRSWDRDERREMGGERRDERGERSEERGERLIFCFSFSCLLTKFDRAWYWSWAGWPARSEEREGQINGPERSKLKSRYLTILMELGAEISWAWSSFQAPRICWGRFRLRDKKIRVMNVFVVCF